MVPRTQFKTKEFVIFKTLTHGSYSFSHMTAKLPTCMLLKYIKMGHFRHALYEAVTTSSMRTESSGKFHSYFTFFSNNKMIPTQLESFIIVAKFDFTLQPVPTLFDGQTTTRGLLTKNVAIYTGSANIAIQQLNNKNNNEFELHGYMVIIITKMKMMIMIGGDEKFQAGCKIITFQGRRK